AVIRVARFLGLVVVSTVAATGCAHAPAVGRGGQVYAVTVEMVDGKHTAARGHLSFSAVAIQVGDRMARVWVADESGGDVESPAVVEGDAAALKAGILLER